MLGGILRWLRKHKQSPEQSRKCAVCGLGWVITYPERGDIPLCGYHSCHLPGGTLAAWQ